LPRGGGRDGGRVGGSDGGRVGGSDGGRVASIRRWATLFPHRRATRPGIRQCRTRLKAWTPMKGYSDTLRDTELRVAAWLSRNHAVIARSEALRLGMSASQVDRQVRSGLWVHEHRGVYRLAASPPTIMGSLKAALLAAGPSAYVSHRSAAWLHGVVEAAPAMPHISVPSDRRIALEGIRATRTRHPARPAYLQGLPCAPILRTIFDCACLLSAAELDALIDTAVAQRRVRLDELAAAASAARVYPGQAAVVRRLEARGVAGSPHPSVLESRMSRALSDHGIPAPRAELRWGPGGRYRLDYAYPELRLVIEVNGWAFHSSPEQARHDATRRNALQAGGWTVLEFDWYQVTCESGRVAAAVAAAIARLRVS
jgi:hypothetical protein